jgi:hypothetical protein
MAEPEMGRERLTRRDALRRGAVAGGALLWTAPVIHSLATPAYAATPGSEACCQCSRTPPFPGLLKGLTCAECADRCAGHGGVKSFTRGAGCLAVGQACVPSDACPQVPCAWGSKGPQRLKRISH